MSPLSAINLLLIGIGLLLLNKERTATYQFFYLSGVTFICLLMLISFNFIADIPTFINLSVYEAIGFMMLSAAIYFAQPMLQKKISFEQKMFTALSAIIILISVLGIFSSYYSDKRISTSQWVKHTNDVLNETQQILSLTKDIENDSRGYIITGDTTYLQHFVIAKNNIFNHDKKLKELTDDNPSQKERIDSLSVLIYKRIGFSIRCIQATNQSGLEVAKQLMITGLGKSYTAAITKVTAEIQQGENNLLTEREKENRKSIVSFNRAFFVLLGSIFILLVIIVLAIRRNIAVRKKAAEKIIESEQMFSTLFYKSPVLKAIIEVSTGKYIDVNDAFVDFFGDTKEDILNKTSAEIIMAGANGNSGQLITHIHKNGFVRDLEMHLKFREWQNQLGIDKY